MYSSSKNRRDYEEIGITDSDIARRNFLKEVLAVIATISLIGVGVVLLVSQGESWTSSPFILTEEAVVGSNQNGESSPVTENQEDILVELRKGTVRGFKMVSRGNRDFLAFRGIPFGKPMVGPLRFQPTEEADAWDGILNATEFGPECSQLSKGVMKGSEDCLHLNVYTPKTLEELGNRRNQLLPTLVYIHGGGPSGSSRRNTGEYFMDEDVVLVGMNYRVGILGNLNLNNSDARGNQGLRDQVLALKWVKANIKKFGGDKRRVTLFGNSFGSMAISTHLLSPMTKGLFHQVICESGQAIFPDHITQSPVEDAYQLGEMLQCNATTTTELVNCLRNTDTETLIIQSRQVLPSKNKLAISANVYTTSVDPKLDGIPEDDVYLPDMPLKLIMGGKTKPMPAIFGAMSGDGLAQSILITISPNLTTEVDQNWEALMPGFLTMPPGQNTNNFLKSAREFYLGNKSVSLETRDNLTNLFTDRLGAHPAHVAAFYEKQDLPQSENVYLYYFTKEVDKSYLDPTIFQMDEEERKELGPAHADELQFLFPYPPFPLVPAGSKNENFSKMMIHLWATFAATGKPELAEGEPEWLPINEKPYGWFELNDEPKMIDLGERMAFWDSFNLTDLYV